MAEKQFVVGVADAFLRDKQINQIVLKGKSLLSSAVTQTVENTEIAGGVGNKLLFDWCYGKRLTANLESASWNEEYLAISNGTGINTGLNDFYEFDEPITLSSGTGTLSKAPVGDVYVQKADGLFVTVTPSGTSIAVSGGGNTTVKATYRTNTSINQIVIAPDEYPIAYELVLKSQILSQGGAKIADLEIVIPEFKPNGGHEISFGATSASTSKMEGKALAYETIDGKEVYAYVNIRPVTANNSYIALAATPTTVSLSSSSTTKQLVVYAIQGGIRSNVIVTSGCTFASGTTATATVSSGGLITRVASGSSVITVTHTASGLTDVVNVTAT